MLIVLAGLVTDKHPEGFFGLQCHAGKEGQVRFRKIRVHELKGDTLTTKP